MVCISLLSYPIPLYLRIALQHSEGAVLCGQRVLVVGKTHLFDYTAHEVPLPIFGLGHDWACAFRGAPLPLWGQV